MRDVVGIHQKDQRKIRECLEFQETLVLKALHNDWEFVLGLLDCLEIVLFENFIELLCWINIVILGIELVHLGFNV